MYGKSFTLRANLLTPGIQAEWQFIRNKPFTVAVDLGLNSPLSHAAWINPIVSGFDNQATTAWGSFFSYPRLRLEGRYYYNLLNRKAKGKSTDYFSGNYLGTSYSFGLSTGIISFSEYESKVPYTAYGSGPWQQPFLVNTFAIYWGMQRHFGASKRWFLDAQLGASYSVSARQLTMYELVNYTLSVYDNAIGQTVQYNYLNLGSTPTGRVWQYSYWPFPLLHLKVGVGFRIR